MLYIIDVHTFWLYTSTPTPIYLTAGSMLFGFGSWVSWHRHRLDTVSVIRLEIRLIWMYTTRWNERHLEPTWILDNHGINGESHKYIFWSCCVYIKSTIYVVFRFFVGSSGRRWFPSAFELVYFRTTLLTFSDTSLPRSRNSLNLAQHFFWKLIGKLSN